MVGVVVGLVVITSVVVFVIGVVVGIVVVTSVVVLVLGIVVGVVVGFVVGVVVGFVVGIVVGVVVGVVFGVVWVFGSSFFRLINLTNSTSLVVNSIEILFPKISLLFCKLNEFPKYLSIFCSIVVTSIFNSTEYFFNIEIAISFLILSKSFKSLLYSIKSKGSLINLSKALVWFIRQVCAMTWLNPQLSTHSLVAGS